MLPEQDSIVIFKKPRLSVDGGLYQSEEEPQPNELEAAEEPTKIKFREGPPFEIIDVDPNRIIEIKNTQPKSILKKNIQPLVLPFVPILDKLSPRQSIRNTPELFAADTNS